MIFLRAECPNSKSCWTLGDIDELKNASQTGSEVGTLKPFWTLDDEAEGSAWICITDVGSQLKNTSYWTLRDADEVQGLGWKCITFARSQLKKTQLLDSGGLESSDWTL